METSRFDRPYDPRRVEERWYRRWEEQGYFHADENLPNLNRFCIVIPPPNITGSLHVGHALNNTLQDILIRWKRMQGYNTLWLPGTDHAGIATQNVVERQLLASGTNREKLGREEFVKRVWQWREESGRTIITQLKRLGASCDWVRERFTMDEGLSAAVREVFVHLYEDGLIYRGERLINWCPRCGTALSDIEVEHEEIKGKMYYIKYPLADPSTLNSQSFDFAQDRLSTLNYLIVATTRPETMLGDTAVAVHPEDPRYNQLIGKEVLLPLTSRRIPIVGDSILVDREFGTGAVKITPAHDFNDEKAGLRHDLPKISIFDEKARIKSSLPDVDPEVMGDIKMLEVSKARGRVTDWLERRGQVVNIEDHKHAIGKCYRCKTIVEPYLSSQWFVKVNDPDPKKSLAAKAIDVVRKGHIRFIPDSWENNYFGWMENIEDWCISRQIWWGHQIPAWYCKGKDKGQCGLECNTPIVAIVAPDRCPRCGSTDLVQDPDVLDTWFSSALWPFSTLGWPQRTKALEIFYPTSVLVTSFDILFFWVARMMMMGLYCKPKEVEGTTQAQDEEQALKKNIPFRDVYIHALVRDPEGQKMSKSKGNVIDPLEIMEKYGTDALRFTLSSMASPGRDIKLSEERIEGYRNFANKIWNAARFLLMNCTNGAKAYLEMNLPDPTTLSLADRWILSRLQRVIVSVNRQLEDYRFDEASRDLYQFLWHEYCDWYLELVKPILYGTDGEAADRTRTVAIRVFETVLRLLHPFMPFITEEIWQILHQQTGKSIVIASYPTAGAVSSEDEAFEGIMNDIISIITAIRTIRNELNVPPTLQLKVSLRTTTEKYAVSIMRNGEEHIRRMARVSAIVAGPTASGGADEVSSTTSAGELFVTLEGVDLEKVRARLEKGLAAVNSELAKVEDKLKNPEFRAKAPANVIADHELRRNELSRQLFTLTKHLRWVKSFPKDQQP